MADYGRRNHTVNIICEETIRYSFVSHLLAALRREGFSVLVNEDNLDQETDDEVRVSIVIISDKHGVSTYVLDKFVKERNNDHVVVPVFYGVDPSDSNLGNLEWRNMLELGSLRNNQSIDSELVKEIVRDVYRKLSPTKRIGIDSKLLEIENLLCDLPWNFRRIGIWGMPGIGKTTLAKAMFDKVSTDYDASSFIGNFDEAFRKDGLHCLVKRIIEKAMKEEFQISSSYVTRPSLLRDKLCDKRILVVMDDVGDPLAAESFLGRLDWLGPGSLIIMTSTDKQVFALCQVNQIYEVHGLSKLEALQLFSQTAFGKDMPDPNDMESSMKVINYAYGNPLALCRYGQMLKGKESNMEVAFLKLKQSPPLETQYVLKSAYSALSDNEKNIFLDIACFFRGENVDYVAQLLEGCRYIPRVGIDVLAEKCLVIIPNNTVQMHVLIQNLLFETSNGEAIQGERCTRLWEPSSIRCLLEHDSEANRESKGTPKRALVAEDIESILLDTSNLTVTVKPDAFKNMFNLRFLKIYSSCSKHVPGLIFPRGLESLPCKLRLLHWENYPLPFFPIDLDLDHLVELNMPYSQLQTLRGKKLEKLKRIRLCHSQKLVEFYIPLYAPNLELIDLQGCKKLQSFADASQLQHLRVMNLSGCTEIKSFPEIPPNIEELHLQGTRIEEIPISIMTHFNQIDRKKLLNIVQDFPADATHNDLESLISLIKVSSHIQDLGKLVHLNMRDCSYLLSLPDMRSLEYLQVLDLSGCSKLHEINNLPRNIKELYIAGTAIQELPQLPNTLESLNAHGCKHLKSVLLNFEQLPRRYTFSNCVNLSSQVITEFLMKDLTKVARLATEQHQELIKTPEVSICVPAELYKKSSFLLQTGSKVMIELNPSTRNTFSGFAMGVLVYFQDNYDSSEGLSIRCECTWKAMNGHLEKIVKVFQCWAPMEATKVVSDHIFVFYVSGKDLNLTADKVTFKFYTVSRENEVLDYKSMVTKCGVQVIKASTDEDISVDETARVSESSSRTLKEYCLSDTHSLLPKVGKVKSKRNMFSRFFSCVRLVETI